MRFPLLLALLISASSVLRADEGEYTDTIKTISGRTYTHCQVIKKYPDGITFRHSKGMAKVLFSDLTPEERASFGYDAAKEEAYEHKMAEDRAKAQDEAAERAEDASKAWATAYAQALQAEAMEGLYGGQGGGGYGGGFIGFGLGGGGWAGDNYGYGQYGNEFYRHGRSFARGPGVYSAGFRALAAHAGGCGPCAGGGAPRIAIRGGGHAAPRCR